jgi:hypothetical protein
MYRKRLVCAPPNTPRLGAVSVSACGHKRDVYATKNSRYNVLANSSGSSVKFVENYKKADNQELSLYTDGTKYSCLSPFLSFHNDAGRTKNESDA